VGLTKLLVEIKLCGLLPVGLMKPLIETQLICGPNEAHGRNQVVWSFTYGPNKATARNQIMWSFTCGPNEAPGRNHDNSIFL
jgi:hypothetical protein